MLLTEEEARKKWCPMYRAVGAGNATDFDWADNRVGDFEGSPLCIASQCMAWRWYAAFVDNEAAPQAAKDDYVKQIGYCGLAGKPE